MPQWGRQVLEDPGRSLGGPSEGMSWCPNMEEELDIDLMIR